MYYRSSAVSPSPKTQFPFPFSFGEGARRADEVERVGVRSAVQLPSGVDQRVPITTFSNFQIFKSKKMAAVTIYKNFTQPFEVKALMFILDIIKGETHKEKITKIRTLISEGKREEADAMKKSLPAFTPSCRCEGGRDVNKVVYYTGFIILDIDKISQEEILRISELLKVNEYVFGFFISPSGNGIKILIETDSDKEHHESAYNKVAAYFSELLNVTIDRSGKDVVRLCFMSYDPHTFKNLRNKKFNTNDAHGRVSSPTINLDDSAVGCSSPSLSERGSGGEAGQGSDLTFLHCISLTEQKSTYTPGTRNNFIYLLANNCNRAGIPQNETNELIRANFDLPDKEIAAAIKSAFQKNTHEFARFAVIESLQSDDSDEVNEQIKNAPFLPEHVFESLPYILKESVDAFTDLRQRDVVLTSSITILSGCLPNLTGIYDKRSFYANLNCLIVAPPASGKGAMISARDLGVEYDKELLNDSREKLKDYKRELNNYKFRQKKSKGDFDEEEPEQPPLRMLYFPANSSSAAMINALSEGDGRGIICKTETDTLANTFKNDWGGYSDLLRKSFGHEPVSSNRKSDGAPKLILRPQLSVVLSGTPSQTLGLISSSEDGLFSRFLYYTYKPDLIWQDVSPAACKINLTSYFNHLSFKVKEMILHYESMPSSFDLTNEQWQQLNSQGAKWLSQFTAIINDDIAGTVYRLGLITFRIAMIFTALRNYHSKNKLTNLICSDLDFSNSLALAEVYLQHAILMFKFLPNGSSTKQDNKKQNFYQALPSIFNRQSAHSIANGLAIKGRTADLYLSKFIKANLICKDDHTKFRKT